VEIIKVKARIKEIIFETTNIRVEDIGDEAMFVEDLEFDSLTMMEIAVNVDQEFDLDLPEDDFDKLVNVNACAMLVMDYKCKEVRS